MALSPRYRRPWEGALLLICFAVGAVGCGSADPLAGLGDAGGDSGSVATDAGLPPPDSGTPDVARGDEGVVPDAGSANDAGSAGDSGSADGGLTSRCMQTQSNISCTYDTEIIRIGSTVLSDREVHYEVPASSPPAAGFAVVIVFQGSFNSAELVWDSNRNAPFGRYYMSATVKELLDRGYAVITPEAHIGGATFWDTNVLPFSVLWETSNDHRLMLEIFDRIDAGTFGPLDSARMYATGISSGGYMSSRMAVSYGGRFKALAIHSGSYATCAGALCVLPAALPADHPPTLFAHGAADLVVPVSTMRDYADRLVAEGVDVDTVVNQTAGHEWLLEAVLPIPDWFDAHP